MEKNSIVMMSVGGFEVVIPSKPCLELDPSTLMADKWELILIPNRLITFTHLFKTIVEQCGGGYWFTRVRFYEQWEKPIDMVLKIHDPKTIIILNSNPEPYRLAYRIAGNPRYSSMAVFAAKIHGELYVSNWVIELARVAHKLYLEVSPVVFTRGLGRLAGIRVSREPMSNSVAIDICIDKEFVAPQKIVEHGIQVGVMSIKNCLGL